MSGGESEHENSVIKESNENLLEDSLLFESLSDRVDEKTLKAVSEMGLKEMTKIQHLTIIPLLDGKDVFGTAKTGSGKTLAFLIPIVYGVYKRKMKPRDGIGALIISPTRELALQTFGVLKDLMKYHSQTYSYAIGGSSKNEEIKKLKKGVNILVATPGRCLDHLRSQSSKIHNLFILAFDETDRLLEIGFKDDISEIVSLLPKKRQTLMFSATQTDDVKKLSTLALNNSTLCLSAETSVIPTVETLKQGFIVTPPEYRLSLLFTFIKKCQSKKIMVFFSSCASVQFHADLFNYIDLPGQQKQSKRSSTFLKFSKATSGTLFCTDVAARGLDIPAVDWIVQYDPPNDPREYIHRVGRTARASSSGQAVLILMKEELTFVQYLKSLNIPITEFDFRKAPILDIHQQIMALIDKNYQINTLGRLAFKSFLQAYASHSNKDIFNVNKIDISKICQSFGFLTPPPVNLGKRARKTPVKKPNKGVGKALSKKSLKTK